MKKHNLFSIAFYIISAELIGGLSALITGDFSSFFLTYKEPPLLPPSWLFPVVWVILYAVMGYSAYRISITKAPDQKKKNALTVYWAQLGVNFLWSIVFFKAELLWGGVAVIALLLILIAVMISLFYKLDKTAALINVPYLLWVLFATYLNIATAVIN